MNRLDPTKVRWPKKETLSPSLVGDGWLVKKKNRNNLLKICILKKLHIKHRALSNM